MPAATMLKLACLLMATLVLAGPTWGDPLQVEAGSDYETLSNGQPDWTEQYLLGRQDLGHHRTWYGLVRHTNRFNQDDEDFEAGGSWPLSRDLTFIGSVSDSPTGRVLPQYTYLAHVYDALGHGWTAELGFQHQHYAQVDVGLDAFTVEKYWGNYRAAAGLTVAQTPFGAVVSSNVQFNRYYGERDNIGFRIDVGNELAQIGNGNVLDTSVRSVAVTGMHWFDARWGVSYVLGLHDQNPLYTRRQIEVGLRHAF